MSSRMGVPVPIKMRLLSILIVEAGKASGGLQRGFEAFLESSLVEVGWGGVEVVVVRASVRCWWWGGRRQCLEDLEKGSLV